MAFIPQFLLYSIISSIIRLRFMPQNYGPRDTPAGSGNIQTLILNPSPGGLPVRVQALSLMVVLLYYT